MKKLLVTEKNIKRYPDDLLVLTRISVFFEKNCLHRLIDYTKA